MTRPMKHILLLIFSLNLLMTSCQVKQFGEGVRNDTKRIFFTNKDYIYSLAFEGIVTNKEVCNNCNINKYNVRMTLSGLSKKPDISNIQYPPYYMFEGDSILTISVTKDLFDLISENDKILKGEKEPELTINGKKESYLSKKKNKWLP